MAHSITSSHQDVAQINITPLVDVLLVLLVIFMIAAPVISQPIPLDLPQGGKADTFVEPTKIELRIDAAGQLTWNGQATPMSALEAMMTVEVGRDPRNAPLLQIDASGESDYDVVAKVLAAARNARLEQIAFIQR